MPEEDLRNEAWDYVRCAGEGPAAQWSEQVVGSEATVLSRGQIIISHGKNFGFYYG